MILDGDLKPGDKIAERLLCERFGVSRTPLREALKVLAAEGLVQLLPQRGAIVAEISQDEIEEVFPIMAGARIRSRGRTRLRTGERCRHSACPGASRANDESLPGRP